MGNAFNDGAKATIRQAFIILLIAIVYLLASYWLVGFKSDQLVLIFIFIALFFISSGTRKFIVGFSIFIVYWIIFDYMKAFPNYNSNTFHIAVL